MWTYAWRIFSVQSAYTRPRTCYNYVISGFISSNHKQLICDILDVFLKLCDKFSFCAEQHEDRL